MLRRIRKLIVVLLLLVSALISLALGLLGLFTHASTYYRGFNEWEALEGRVEFYGEEYFRRVYVEIGSDLFDDLSFVSEFGTLGCSIRRVVDARRTRPPTPGKFDWWIFEGDVILERRFQFFSECWHTLPITGTPKEQMAEARRIGVIAAQYHINSDDVQLFRGSVLFALLPAIAVARALIRVIVCRLRGKEGFCRKCGYNLTGNISGICPECGKLIECAVKEETTEGVA